MHDNFYRENNNSHEYKHNITHSHSLKRIHTFLHTRLLLERRDTPKKIGLGISRITPKYLGKLNTGIMIQTCELCSKKIS